MTEPAAPEFCYHPKDENGRTVPPCLRTLRPDGTCPIHDADVGVAW